MIFLSHNNPLTKCSRCGFKTPTKEDQCNYCNGLSDAEVEKMLQEHSIEFKGNPTLIKQAYLVLTCILLILVIYGFIN